MSVFPTVLMVVKSLMLEPKRDVLMSNNTQIVKIAMSKNMLFANGWIGDTKITTLSDTGCSGVIVKQCFVRQDQYTGHEGFIQLVDNSIKRVLIDRVEVDKPYLSGTVEALYLQDTIYDVIIGNVPGAKSPHQSDSDVHLAAKVTRAQAKLKETITQLKVLRQACCLQSTKND